MNLTAIHVLSGVAYNIEMKVDTQLNTTLTTFKVDNENLPFDENYNAIIDVYNPPSNISSRLICFNLSKFCNFEPKINNISSLVAINNYVSDYLYIQVYVNGNK